MKRERAMLLLHMLFNLRIGVFLMFDWCLGSLFSKSFF
jgi:hypothetical protein